MSRLLAFLVSLLICSAAQAAIVEDITRIPVAVTTAKGVHRQEITVTIFRDTAAIRRAPLIVYQHGRSATPKGRQELRRSAPVIARDLVRRGFVVIAPTRIGYGETGGPDLEGVGSCSNEDFPRVFDIAQQQALATLSFAKSLPYADATTVIAMGVSFGGASSLALAAQGDRAIKAVVNLGGGMGGDADKHPHAPCQPERLERTFASYGPAIKVPTLWLYAPNDGFWGPTHPKEWFAAFTANKGKGRFVWTPPMPGNGHTYLLNSGLWFAEFDRFISQVLQR